MKRKLLALTLAMTTLVGSTMMVSAADITDAEGAATGQEITGESEMSLPVIKVTVPTTADIVINPFQLSYDKDGVTGNSQIISAEQEITNESNVAVAVNVSDLQVKNASEGITITTSAINAKTTNKAALLYLEVIDATGTFGTGFDAKSTSQVAIPKPEGKVIAASKAAIVTLKAGNETATKAKFKIGGNVVANPVDGEGVSTPWVDEDSIELGFKFTFTPQIVSAE